MSDDESKETPDGKARQNGAALPDEDFVCEFCGRSGQHPECEAAAAEAFRRERESLRRFAINGEFGPVSADPTMSLDEAVDEVARCLGWRPEFRVESVIENERWWYIPVIWIGCLGFVVDKSSGEVFPLGSGLGSIPEALDAYQEGLLHPLTRKGEGA